MRSAFLMCLIASTLSADEALQCEQPPPCGNCSNCGSTSNYDHSIYKQWEPPNQLLDYDECKESHKYYPYYGHNYHFYDESYNKPAKCTPEDPDPCLWCKKDNASIPQCDGDTTKSNEHLCEPPPPLPPCMSLNGTLQTLRFGCTDCERNNSAAWNCSDIHGTPDQPFANPDGICVGIFPDETECDCQEIRDWLWTQFHFACRILGTAKAWAKYMKVLKHINCKYYDYSKHDYNHYGFEYGHFDHLAYDSAQAEVADKELYLRTQTEGGVPVYAIVMLAVFGAFSLLTLCAIGVAMCARKYYVYDEGDEEDNYRGRNHAEELTET